MVINCLSYRAFFGVRTAARTTRPSEKGQSRAVNRKIIIFSLRLDDRNYFAFFLSHFCWPRIQRLTPEAAVVVAERTLNLVFFDAKLILLHSRRNCDSFRIAKCSFELACECDVIEALVVHSVMT
jgi:hypothetical protein